MGMSLYRIVAEPSQSVLGENKILESHWHILMDRRTYQCVMESWYNLTGA